MRFSEQWLREWVNPDVSTTELGLQLTQAGFEVEEIAPVATQSFTGVLIGEIKQIKKDEEYSGLTCCLIEMGKDEAPLTIITRVTDIREGMRVAVAPLGSQLSEHKIIPQFKVGSWVSGGKLCTPADLGLSDNNEDLYIFPEDVPLGKEVWDYLKLNDQSLEIAITPNRGDCLSIVGIAREVATINSLELKPVEILPARITDKSPGKPVLLKALGGCAHYTGRIIRNIDLIRHSPVWLQEKLRRSGIRSIDPVVDVTNYVMLELGQPLHAFDCAVIQGSIEVRWAKAQEKILLLSGDELTLSTQDLVIADEEKALALAGIMGGMTSGVRSTTKDIFLESAYFAPDVIQSRARYYGINTESSYRYARGVNPTLQVTALERATQLLLEIVGGEAGIMVATSEPHYLPQTRTICLRLEQITRLLGFSIPLVTVTQILQHLGMEVKTEKDTLIVSVPPWRFDITMAADLIEEIIRIYGYDNIPSHIAQLPLKFLFSSEAQVSELQLTEILVGKGYQEIITYAFVDPELQELIHPNEQSLAVVNPIASDLSQMRISLWPGLIQTLKFNQYRQQDRIRCFEIGKCFELQGDALEQTNFIGGIVQGCLYPLQWGLAQSKTVDYYDVKGDLETLFSLIKPQKINFIKAQHPALHPGQSAQIYYDEEPVGWLGALHPRIIETLELNGPIYLFSVKQNLWEKSKVVQYQNISKFPGVKRDLSFIVDENITAQQIIDSIKELGQEWIKTIRIFDVYQGKGIAENQKSVALAIYLEHTSRTLTEEDISNVVAQVVDTLQSNYSITLRE